MVFIDVHCHLDYFKEKEREKIVKESVEKIGIIVTNGTNSETNRKALEISSRFKGVECALGVYPIDALSMTDKEIDDEIRFIENNKDKIIAIGEVGLDKNTEEGVKNIKKQEKNFIKFIRLAKKLKIPVIVHSRKAEKECVEILEKEKADRVVMHCFSGNMKLVKRIEENKWFLSIPANIKISTHFQEIVKSVSIDNLLCETDSPFLHPDKKFPNIPLNVMESYKKIAEIKKISLKDAEKKIENNFHKLFNAKKQ